LLRIPHLLQSQDEITSHITSCWIREIIFPWIMALAACTSSFGFTQTLSGAKTTAAMSTEEVALRVVVEKFFAAYGKKDLFSVMELWSEKSPNLAAYKQNLERQFTAEDLSFGSPEISRVKVESGKASLRVTILLTSINLKSRQKSERRLAQIFEFVMEGEEWKLWRNASAVKDLAEVLVKIDGEAARAKLLAEEKDLVTVELGQELMSQARRLFIQDGYKQAMGIYELALEIARQSGDKRITADALRGIGITCESQGNYTQALERLQASLRISEEISDKSGIARTLRYIGIVYSDQRNRTQALEMYQKSLNLSEEIGDKVAIAHALNSIGNVRQSQGNYTQALEVYQESLKIREEIGDKADITGMLNNIGSIYQLQGNYSQALELYQKGLKFSEESGDKYVIASILNNIGLVYKYQYSYTQALEMYQKSLKIREEIGDKAGIAKTLSRIANIHASQGNYIQGLEITQKRLGILKEIGDKAGIANALFEIGSVHESQGNYAQAMEMYKRSLGIHEEVGNKRGAASTLLEMGNIHKEQGNYTQALELYQKCLRIQEEVGDKAGIAVTLNNIGGIYQSRGDYAQAMEICKRSLGIREEVGDKAGIAVTLNNIGEVHKMQGDHTQALHFAERAVALATQLGLTNYLWKLRTSAGDAYFALNQLSEARLCFDQAIADIETLRFQVAGGEQEQQRFFESKTSPYYAMVKLLIAQNNPGEALTYAERARGRALLDVISGGRISITKVMTDQEKEQERKLNSQLVSLNSQIYVEKLRSQPDPARLSQLEAQRQKARLDSEAFRANLYAAHSELKTRRGEAAPLRFEQAGSLMPGAGTALLEFVVVSDRTYLFVLTKAPQVEVKVYPIEVKEKDLTDRVEGFQKMLSTADNSFSKPAHELYDLLLKPAAAELLGKSRLVIVPDGSLWELPFQALQTPRDRYLIDDHAIFYTPSLTVLRETIEARRLKAPKPLASNLLAMGNPALGLRTTTRVKSVLMDVGFDPLPEAEQQVKALAKIYGHEHSKVYVGTEAREGRFKSEAKGFRVLHLATHGILNDHSPMYSYLLLAQTGEETEEDGMLEAWELMRLDLKADLAVLSACETARGRVGKGEGMIGLTWALFVAGVPTTVVSQWKVRSDSTAELMVEFHRELKSRLSSSTGRYSAAEALRAAALKLKRDHRYQHPFDWASFVVIGDGY